MERGQIFHTLVTHKIAWKPPPPSKNKEGNRDKKQKQIFLSEFR